MPVNLVYGLISVSAFFWGANFVLAGSVLADLPPLWAAALRFLLGAGVMLAVARWQGDDVLGLARSHWRAHVLLGILGIVGFNLFFFYAMAQTSAANGALIMATNPVLTTRLASALLREQIASRQLAALPVALAGVAVVISQGELTQLSHFAIGHGDALMLCANLVWALYNVATRRFMPRGSPVGNTALMMTVGAVVLTMIAVSQGAEFALPGLHAGTALAIMVLGGTVLAYLFWGMGIQRLGAGRAALFLNLVPVFAMLIGGVIGTPPSAVQLIGGALVLFGVTLAALPLGAAAQARGAQPQQR